MPDSVILSVEGRSIDQFKSYSIDADLFLAAGQFSFECTKQAAFVDPGMRVKLWINKQCEMTGLVDRVEQNVNKKGRSITLSGRDLQGLLCDHCCENFGTVDKLNGKTLMQIAETLIRNVPFILKNDIVYQDKTAKLDRIHHQEKIDPGETIFEVLKRCAIGRGLLFYCLPDGTFVFGKPKDRGGKSLFAIVCRTENGGGNNVLEGSFIRDISQCYSKITVLGQVQGQDDFGSAAEIQVSGSAFVPGNVIPFYKPLVITSNKDGTSPSREAAFISGQQIARTFGLSYVVPGHSQPCGNWKINELCSVRDETFTMNGKTINDSYLIYGRTFERDLKNGSTTRLRLGYPGVIVSD